jgi:hypothetical protein
MVELEAGAVADDEHAASSPTDASPTSQCLALAEDSIELPSRS